MIWAPIPCVQACAPFSDIGWLQEMNIIILNFVKVIVQWLTNCLTSYGINQPTQEAKVRLSFYTPFAKMLDTTRALRQGLWKCSVLPIAIAQGENRVCSKCTLVAADCPRISSSCRRATMSRPTALPVILPAVLAIFTMSLGSAQ